MVISISTSEKKLLCQVCTMNCDNKLSSEYYKHNLFCGNNVIPISSSSRYFSLLYVQKLHLCYYEDVTWRIIWICLNNQLFLLMRKERSIHRYYPFKKDEKQQTRWRHVKTTCWWHDSVQPPPGRGGRDGGAAVASLLQRALGATWLVRFAKTAPPIGQERSWRARHWHRTGFQSQDRERTKEEQETFGILSVLIEWYIRVHFSELEVLPLTKNGFLVLQWSSHCHGTETDTELCPVPV